MNENTFAYPYVGSNASPPLVLSPLEISTSSHFDKTSDQPTEAGFKDLNLPDDLLTLVPFAKPTPVQAQTIPHSLAGSDILATAQTGSGKTLAYGLPLMARLLDNPSASALVLTPTRELADQVLTELEKLIPASSGICSALLVGGQSYGPQFRQLNSGARLIVGTPGRIIDHLLKRSLRLNEAKIVVLDEADRMLDMGFAPQVAKISSALPLEHQTLFFSATMDRSVEKIAATLLKNPVRISVGTVNRAAPLIEQIVERVPRLSDKLESLAQILKETNGSVLVFVNTRELAETLATSLSARGRPANFLHGHLNQRQREQTTAKFRNDASSVLVATDLAGRGLDIPHIRCVVNYQLPGDCENYVHRIGRTGRAGASGLAINIIDRSEEGRWRKICKYIGTDPRASNPACITNQSRSVPVNVTGAGAENIQTTDAVQNESTIQAAAQAKMDAEPVTVIAKTPSVEVVAAQEAVHPKSTPNIDPGAACDITTGSKGSEEMPHAHWQASAREVLKLSRRQQQVYDAILAGQSNAEIAAALALKPGNVSVQISMLYNRLKLTGKERSHASIRAWSGVREEVQTVQGNAKAAIPLVDASSFADAPPSEAVGPVTQTGAAPHKAYRDTSGINRPVGMENDSLSDGSVKERSILTDNTLGEEGEIAAALKRASQKLLRPDAGSAAEPPSVANAASPAPASVSDRAISAMRSFMEFRKKMREGRKLES